MRKLMVLICLIFITALLGCSMSSIDTTTSAHVGSGTATETKTQETTAITSLTTTTSCAHEPQIIEGKEETCLEEGYTSMTVCKICGAILIESETIPKKHKLYLESLCVKEMEGFKKPAVYKCCYCDYAEYQELHQADLGLPILTVEGSLSGISKDNKVQVKMIYEDESKTFETLGTMKYQGATSLYYPKHNFNIQFLKDDSSKFKIEMVDGWGKESKYCLKANYVDFSQARNVVSAKLYGDVVHSREIDDEFDKLVNGGAIDGFPVILYIGSEFQGIYTFNIPKDKWMFDMGDNEKEAILMADAWGKSVSLKEHINEDFSNGWDLEYCSTDDSKWVVDSFNEMMDCLKLVSLDYTYVDRLDQYINIERAIDSMLFTMMICALDNLAKNTLWVTYDGKKWTPSMYDMDGVMGLYWNGEIGKVDPYGSMPESLIRENLLWEILFKTKKKKIAERYIEIRQEVLTKEYVSDRYIEFMGSIPKFVYDADRLKWKDTPSNTVDQLNQIIQFMEKRFDCLDKYFLSCL